MRWYKNCCLKKIMIRYKNLYLLKLPYYVKKSHMNLKYYSFLRKVYFINDINYIT